MVRRNLIPLGVVGVLAGCGWLLAQQGLPPSPKEAGAAPYTICPAGDSAVLLDGARGKSWVLGRRGDRAAWLPIPRLDSESEAARWQKAAAADADPTGGRQPAAVGKALREAGYVSIPLDRLNAGYLALEVQVNGKKVYLSLDTGSPNTHLDAERTRALGLKWQKPKEPAPGPFKDDDQSFAEVEGLQVGPFRTGRLVVGSHDMTGINACLKVYHDPLLDGVLGDDVLQKYSAVIDSTSLRLYLLKRQVEG